jgi:hypothetical protein
VSETVEISARERNADFHTSEWELLASEVGENFRLVFQLSVYALIANGFIMAWVAQAGKDVFSPVVMQLAAAIPVLITMFAYAFYRFLLWRSAVIYQYLFEIESKVASDGLGWENFYRKLSKHGRTKGVGWIFKALFLIQFVVGVAFTVMVYKKYN